MGYAQRASMWIWSVQKWGCLIKAASFSVLISFLATSSRPSCRARQANVGEDLFIMIARRVVFFVPALVVSLVLLATESFESKAADRPNQASQSDLAAGQLIDSLFGFEKPASLQPTNHRSSRRQFATRLTTLEGKLVRNPDRGDGAPSFALVDRYGGVLRYVEPIERIDLSQYVGQTVGVRRDTGDTLLASQLALPNANPGQWPSGVRLANFEEVIPQGEIVEGPIVMPEGQEPVYLDEGLNFGDCTECGSYIRCGTACRAARRQRFGAYFNYELTILQPVISEVRTGPLEDDYGFGHRFVLGYQGGSGMGARVRYWFYNHGHDYTNAANGSIGIDMDVLDLEITLDEQLRSWDFMVSGGLRYGRAGLTDSIPTTFIGGNAEFAFEGFGPTFSLEATRGFGDRGLYFIGNFRTSLLFGDFDNFRGAPGVTVDGEITTILESQLGIGCSRNLGRATLNFRTVWETQFWLNDTWGNNINGLGSNLGFAGPSTSAEIRF